MWCLMRWGDLLGVYAVFDAVLFFFLGDFIVDSAMVVWVVNSAFWINIVWVVGQGFGSIGLGFRPMVG